MSVTVQSRPGICELRLDSPPANILDRATCVELVAAIREQSEDRSLKAFVFSAAGPNFSYGASIQEHRRGEVEIFLPAFHDVLRSLAETHVPAVAAVRGRCLGGGLELAAFCHFLIAEPDAVFAVPEIQLGVFPPAACVFFPLRFGGAVADSLILTGRELTAEEGHKIGLVTEISPPGGLEATIESFVDRRLRPYSAAALRLATRASRARLDREMAERLPEIEALYLGELMETRDATEGLEAFLAKRKPIWADT